MVYGFILAGGKGTRMGNVGVPKQFLTLNEKPIIIYTIEKFINSNSIDKIIVICNEGYCAYMSDLLLDYDVRKNIYITPGGSTRLESTLNGIKYIEKNWGINDDDIFVAHDSVRPFITDRIINENVEKAKQFKAATTVMDLIETIIETNEDNQIYKAYPRTHLYSGQSPQTFNIKYFMEETSKLTNKQLETFTDLSENIVSNGGTVCPVMGDRNNIKITTPIDMLIANELLNKK